MNTTNCACNTVPRRMKGRNLPLEWSIVDRRNGEPVNLEDKGNIKIQVISPDGKAYDVPLCEIDGNVLRFNYPVSKQKLLGMHSLRMWYNYGTDEQNGCSIRDAFELVEWTEDEAN